VFPEDLEAEGDEGADRESSKLGEYSYQGESPIASTLVNLNVCLK
jgi:hypothetical protein